MFLDASVIDARSLEVAKVSDGLVEERTSDGAQVRGVLGAQNGER